MGDKIGKKDGPIFWAKRRGFSHSDHISAGFELLDFGPKSKDNSWSYIQIFHSVYIEERKKVVWQWERTIAAQLMFGDAICPCCIGEARTRAWRLSTMSFPSTTTRKYDSAKKSATYGLDILNESQGPPPFPLLTYHADHHLYALHLLWLVVGGS